MEKFILDFGKDVLLYTLQFGSIGAMGYSSYKLYKNRRVKFLKELHQTIEDRSCSTHIIGVQGSGKTYYAMMLFLDDIIKGYGTLWMSTQGIDNSGLLDYIPPTRINDIILLKPYIDRPKGINMLRRYTDSSQERTLIADSVVVLFKRLFEDVKDNMVSILTASVLALLEYGDKTEKTVCLWDLYVFFTDEGFRQRIVDEIDNVVVKDMVRDLDDDENKSGTKASLQAIIRRFRKMLYYDHMIAFLSQKEDDVDLLKAVKQKNIIICDFYAGGIGVKGLGKENSKFLAELMVSKMQLIAETRNINSSLFSQYYDEFQTYTSTADNIKDFIDLNRQKRMPVILINQRRHQLTKELQDAVDSCGTKYIFKLNPNDIDHYCKMYPQYKENIPNFRQREYIGDVRSYGKNFDEIKITPDIYKKHNLGYIIEQRNVGKYTVEEIIENTKTKSGNRFSRDDFE